jgi:carbamoyl-phosphate synthase small subunit
MTYPLIGNYGVNELDVESWRPHVAGFVVRELSPVVSNWRADFSLAEYLERHGVPGIQGVDTRALTRKLRLRGALNGFISTEGVAETEAVQRAKQWPGIVGVDYVKDVTHPEAFRWDEKDEQSASFKLARGNAQTDARQQREPLPPADIPIVAYDFGMKYNILRRLRQHGFQTQVVPATAPAAEAMRHKPAGIFLSNGPGDPAALPRSSDSGAGARGQDLQIEVRPSRRQSTGQRPRVRPGGDHVAESWLCCGCEVAAIGGRGGPHQSQRSNC